MIILCLLHIVFCVSIILFYRFKKIHIRTLNFLAILLLPFFGILLFVVEEYLLRKELTGKNAIDIEKMKIQDAKFKRIAVDNNKNQDITIPLEEAMLINDRKTRRSLMIDILRKNPEEYIDLLQKSSLGSDAELTHYATTTMLEIQSNYELKLQKLSKDLELSPDNIYLLKKYFSEYKKYVESGLLSGNIMMIYRHQLSEILDKLLIYEPKNEEYILYRVENLLKMNDLESVESILGEMKLFIKDKEKLYMLYVEYYRKISRGDLVKQVMNEIAEKEIYLTTEGKQWYEFWTNGEFAE